MARESFNHVEIEQAARQKWAGLNLYETDLTDETKEKYYLLFEFPYPSGDLHIGHWYAFALTDIYARKLRMAGKNVLFPMGFDAFGLPAENAAIKRGLDPKKWTYDNMANMRRQLETMGASMDWSKEVITCDPSYYKWTQWLFTKFLEHGLAERRLASVKWCPNDKTVLANEQVVDGKCERCGHEVEDKMLTQWFLKITAYAERLLADLDGLAWPNEIKEAQRAWIGQSDGAKITFPVATGSETTDIQVFTTRPDTLYGATYLVLAPEHPALESLLAHATNVDAVRAYQKATGKKTERERSENKEKTGVVLDGLTATNPATKESIPVYVADYVLASYGTGAVMAVPAHDERDYEFAKKYNLPIRYVIDPITGEEQVDPKHKEKIVAVVEHNGKVLTINWPKELGGRLLVGGTVNEGEDPAITASREIGEETGYKELELIERADEKVHHSYFAFSKNQATLAHTTILHFKLASDTQSEQELEEDEKGKFTVEWVTPEVAVKEIHDDQHQYALARFLGKGHYTGDGLLTNSGDFTGKPNREAIWDIAEAAGGERVKQFRIRDWSVGRQRYWGCPIPVVYDPEGNPHPIPSEHLPWLLPEDVDMTPGAAGEGKSPLASSKELQERVTRIFGEGWTPEYDTLDTFVDSSWYFFRYLDPKDEHDFSDAALMKKWMPIDRYSGGSEHTTMHLLYARFFTKVLYDLALSPVSEPFSERFNRGIVLGTDGAKMSKSKGNVVNPDEVVAKFGADAVRMYLAFIGPYNEPGHYPWNLDGTLSMRKFLDRVYALASKADDSEPNEATLRALALATSKVTGEIDRFKFNTALSALMVLVRDLEALPAVPRQAVRTLLVLLAPFAPHLTEHLWGTLGEEGSVHAAAWPTADESLLVADEVVLTVQVNGKKRGEITIAPDASEADAVDMAIQIASVKTSLGKVRPSRVIYVPGRILNLVV